MNSFDYRVQLVRPLVQFVQKELGCLLIESNSSGKQPDYPFLTYTITSPFIKIGFEDAEDEPFEAVISLTVHDDSSLDALNLATKLRKSFTTEKSLRKFGNLDIVIVTMTPSAPRDTMITIDYERLAGFDLRVRLRDSFEDDSTEPLENITLGGNTNEG